MGYEWGMNGVCKMKMTLATLIILIVVIVSCGINNPSILNLIDGYKIAKGKWLSVVALIHKDTKSFCTGSLREEDVILTDAHCIFEPNEISKFVKFFMEENKTKLTTATQQDKRRLLEQELLKFLKYRVTRVGIYFGEGSYLAKDAQLEYLATDYVIDKSYFNFLRLQLFEELDILQKGETPPKYREVSDLFHLKLKKKIKNVEIVPVITQEEFDLLAMTGVVDITLIGFGLRKDKFEVEKAAYKNIYGEKYGVDVELVSIFDQRKLLVGKRGSVKGACLGDSGGPGFLQLANKQWRQIGVIATHLVPCGHHNNVMQAGKGTFVFGASTLLTMVGAKAFH